MSSVCVNGVVTKLKDGLFEIDDRGDGFAEIHLNGDFGEVSAEDVAVWAEWDRQLGRVPLEVPVGFKHTSLILSCVHGLVNAPMDEKGNYTGVFTSAFPGWVQIKGAPQKMVENLSELEQYLESNMDAIFKLMLKHSVVPSC